MIIFLFFIILGLLNFILKEWCTISRGAEPHAQKADDEKVLKGLLTLVVYFGPSEAMAQNIPQVYTTIALVRARAHIARTPEEPL